MHSSLDYPYSLWCTEDEYHYHSLKSLDKSYYTNIASDLIVDSLPCVIISRFNAKVGNTCPHIAFRVIEQTHADPTAFISV